MTARKSARRGWVVGAFVALAALALAVAGIAWLNVRGEDGLEATSAGGAAHSAAAAGSRTDDAALVSRGAYLARAGNCAGCHTEPGGAAYAGGLGIATPFGSVYASNLTPDATTGLGQWNAAEFRRALRHGRSRSGRLLYPAFPYENYSRVNDADADALFAFVRSLPAVAQANRPHALRFPFDTQAALALWRALYFRPAAFVPDTGRSAEANRGAYLVQGLGHCSACHASRNALGANSGPLALGGGLIPQQNWYAPSLSAAHEAGVAGWRQSDVVALLKTGVAPSAGVAGPMAEVVLGSTQYLTDADLRAMAVYLQALPQTAPTAMPADTRRDAEIGDESTRAARGRTVYENNCASCHGEQGEGVAGAYPALAGNRAVRLSPPANLVHVLTEGGFAPATAGNPRPFGMPPFGQVLTADEIAAVLTYLRSAWGHAAPAVSAQQVARYRGGAG